MRFKIKDIPAAGAPLLARVAATPELLAEVLQGTGGEVSRSKIELEVELVRDHDQIIGRDRAKGFLDQPCSRCLEPARVLVDAPIDLVFSREGSEVSTAGAKDDDEAADLLDQPDAFTHDGLTVSLEQPLRELLIAELPISPLCKADCLGLCATCGANRNTDEGRACGHGQTDTDPETSAPPGTRKGLAALAEVKLPS